MSSSERKKIFFAIFFITLTLAVFSTTFLKTLSTNDNYQNTAAKLTKTEIDSVVEKTVEKSTVDENTIIRSGKAMQLDGSYLYLIDYYFNLEVYDISNLEEPVKIATYDDLELDSYSSIVVQDDYIYLRGDYSTFYILNCSNPLAITEIAKYYFLDEIEKFAIKNNSLHIIHGNYYQIYDITTFISPALVGEYFNSSSLFIDLTIKGNYTYLLDFRRGYSVIETSNASNPTLAYKNTIDEANYFVYLYINDTLLFINDNTNHLIYIYDISNPLSHSLITSLDLYSKGIRILVDGSLLFLTFSNGFHIADLSELPTVQHLGSYDSKFEVRYMSLFFRNNHLILHNDKDPEYQGRFPIVIVNIVDPSKPKQVYPSDGIPTWLIPVIITLVVLIIGGPLAVIFIINRLRKRKHTLQNET